MEMSELAHDPRFATGADRMAHLKELEAELSKRYREKPAQIGSTRWTSVACPAARS
jgi:hypothetical protein